MSSPPIRYNHNRIVRRITSLPTSIIGSISRAMEDGMSLAGIGRRRNNNHHHPNFHAHPASLSPTHDPLLLVPEEWKFLNCFEQQFGTNHPFFYACRFADAMKLAEQDHKFMFMYLHSQGNPFADVFCKETLCSELVTEFLDVNFVCWGALADRGEGLRMAATLRLASFPCAVMAPSSGDSITVLQQLEGPLSPAELVEILQITLEEQGVAFGCAKAQQEEKIRAEHRLRDQKIQADRRLREEQDVAYLAALQIDKEKEKYKNSPSRVGDQKSVEAQNARNVGKLNTNSVNISKQNNNNNNNKVNGSIGHKRVSGIASRGSESQATQILIRFPNGERREHTFMCNDKIQSIFSYIDSLGMPGIGNYRLITNFPRKSYGVDQMRMTLKEAGLYPKASMFLEPI